MTLHNYLLPRFRRFHETFPSIKFRIQSFTAISAVAALKNGDLDFAVVISPIPKEDDFLVCHLDSFQDIVVAGPAFSFLEGRNLALEKICYPILLSVPKGNCNQRILGTAVFCKQGLSPTADIELPTTDLLCPLADENLGLALVPENFAQDLFR